MVQYACAIKGLTQSGAVLLLSLYINEYIYIYAYEYVNACCHTGVMHGFSIYKDEPERLG